MLYSGIKQGLPLSPYLFLFYIDDVFTYLDDLFRSDSTGLLDNIHILIHADDANLIATTKDMMIQKLKRMLDYCGINSVILQLSKCHFTVINGTVEDQESLRLSSDDSVVVVYKPHLEILGSHISGNLITDLELHLQKRFHNVIKFFNYVRSNPVAPVAAKLDVFKACVMTTLLHNCEAFGPRIPKGLEEMYFKMLRAALGVRHNCPKLTALIEGGCLPLKCLIQCRQLKHYRRFQKSIGDNSARGKIFDHLLENSSENSYLKHYVDLDGRYTTDAELIEESLHEVKENIRQLAANKDKHYKFWMYLQINPELSISPFLYRVDPVGKSLIKFRVGSHNLKIETGRWANIPREERLCSSCHVLEDERHIIFDCCQVNREDLPNIQEQSLSSIWKYEKVNTLFDRIRRGEYVL